MYIINYYNIEVKVSEFNLESDGKLERELAKLTYTTTDEDFEYWLDVIQKSYGKYGDVTYEHQEDKTTPEQLTLSMISDLIIENKKKDIYISNLANQIVDLNIKLQQIGGKIDV